MKIVGHSGARAHAPANSRVALVSAYTAGADALLLTVRSTLEGVPVLADQNEHGAMTGQPGRISDTSLADLRLLDFAAAFRPRGDGGDFSYFDPAVPGRRLELETLEDILDWLPRDAATIILLRGPDQGSTAATARGVIAALRDRGRLRGAILGGDSDALLALLADEAPEAQRALLIEGDGDPPAGADLAIAPLDRLHSSAGWTAQAERLEALVRAGTLELGVCAIAPGPVAADQAAKLRGSGRLWGLAVDSPLDLEPLRRGYDHSRESFAGDQVDRERFALGYAKANHYAVVRWHDGVHVDIAPYDGPLPGGGGDAVTRRLSRLEWDLINFAKEWPFYSGGGVGTVRGIVDDFAAEVSYEGAEVGQATTLEMAVLNVDPGAHRSSVPTSFRHKDSFYDPHGAPPYVGVEHDEDDGFRINWNLGSEYDNNQYGRPVGDGRRPRSARLRLERRGGYFAAYYKQPCDSGGASLPPGDWVCVGVTRNESLNATLFLRCVAKRWRQEKEGDPRQHEPIIANRFTFRDLHIRCFPKPQGD
ncbi:glycerophosphodiester phosphodiesterase family protein [Sphingomonas sp. CCH5-D11]|uniref:glycerophosphodiester phosphodiesterase family protein n=1 Tax=Sphingomonas sp. CCH5-D11 TaxID=1768786 RepID=UPI00082DEFFB|nr:glycerophosphodiester phosphodiesterase family protein [Sphingomonas sp. CCH5-D11]